jgi:Undecaprenyl-phosphate glucose phosphotransferase
MKRVIRETRRRAILTAAVIMAVDALMLEIAFLVAYWMRFYSGLWLVPLGIPPLDLYLGASIVVILVFIGIFYADELYEPRRGRRLVDEFIGLFRGVVLGSLLVLALAFFLKREAFSRAFFGLFFLASLFALTAGRLLTRRVVRQGLPSLRLLLVGASPMRARVQQIAHDLPGLGLNVVGTVAVPGEEQAVPRQLNSVAAPFEAAVRRLPPEAAPVTEVAGVPESVRPCLGRLDEIRKIVQDHAIDRVVLTLPFDHLDRLAEVTGRLANLNVDLQFVPDLFALHLSRMRVTELGGIPFLAVRGDALSGADRIVKRSFDLVCAALGLIVLAPLFGIIALLVKLSSPGPVLYHQPRVGRDGREFMMLKFRSMRNEAERRSGPVWAVRDDPRVTRIGHWLRRWSLDELPQLWNVVRGEMSLVGPRPERKVFVDEFSRTMPRYFERHRVKSGLTGWAQVNGLRGDTGIEERTLYDLHYVENWSLGLDVRILLMTVHHVLRGENAY